MGLSIHHRRIATDSRQCGGDAVLYLAAPRRVRNLIGLGVLTFVSAIAASCHFDWFVGGYAGQGTTWHQE
jgi:hypothetical protein